MKPSVNIFWFRRDLRLDDNKGLHFALRSGLPVVPLYIFDSDTLDRIEEKRDRRVWFIHSTLQALQARLREMDSALEIYQGQVCDIFQELLGKYDIQSVFINTDYEPSSTLRDMQVEQLLKASGIVLNRYKDLVIFEKSEVVKQDGQPYTVFTPYCKRWKLQVTPMHLAAFPTAHLTEQFYRQPAQEVPTLASLGFKEASFIIPSVRDGKARIASYGATRDFPALLGTSRLGLHLRFGTLSIRELVTVAQRQSEAYL